MHITTKLLINDVITDGVSKVIDEVSVRHVEVGDDVLRDEDGGQEGGQVEDDDGRKHLHRRQVLRPVAPVNARLSVDTRLALIRLPVDSRLLMIFLHNVFAFRCGGRLTLTLSRDAAELD